MILKLFLVNGSCLPEVFIKFWEDVGKKNKRASMLSKNDVSSYMFDVAPTLWLGRNRDFVDKDRGCCPCKEPRD
jgi:hypothetical protein